MVWDGRIVDAKSMAAITGLTIKEMASNPQLNIVNYIESVSYTHLRAHET